MRQKIKTYSELLKFSTFEERLNYLKIGGSIGVSTFGSDRYLNQDFYRSKEWKRLREQIFVRDLGCDLACQDRLIIGRYMVHHINPISVEDFYPFVTHLNDFLFNPEYLITVDPETHNEIHYGVSRQKPLSFVERKPNDMCPWKKT